MHVRVYAQCTYMYIYDCMYYRKLYMHVLHVESYAPFQSMAARESFLTVDSQLVAAPGPAHYTPTLEAHIHVKGGDSLQSKVHTFMYMYTCIYMYSRYSTCIYMYIVYMYWYMYSTCIMYLHVYTCIHMYMVYVHCCCLSINWYIHVYKNFEMKQRNQCNLP